MFHVGRIRTSADVLEDEKAKCPVISSMSTHEHC